jgi:hypothetical protein
MSTMLLLKPNCECGGDLVTRPTRSTDLLARHPATTERSPLVDCGR